MKPRKRSLSRLAMVAVTFGMLLALGIPMWGQEAREAPKLITASGVKITGVPDDWTHHHLVFSNPGTEEDAIRNGTYDKWLKIVNDPRYIIQQLKRGRPAQELAAEDVASIEEIARVRESAGGEELTAPRFEHPIRPVGPRPRKLPRPALHSDWSMDLGSTATVGAGQYPAKYSFSPSSASCSDFVVYNTGLAGSSSQATVVAYSNLYAGTCSGTVPSTYWAYNTVGTAALSPIISGVGTQIAYIQTSGGVASLVLLKWATGGTVGSPVTLLTPVGSASYRGCTAPCYTTFTLGTTDSNSPPFYDFNHDEIYVGDDSGTVHKFTGVFYGTPTEVVASPWPVSVGSAALTGPIYDWFGDILFVADASGYFHSFATTDASTGTVYNSSLLAASPGIIDAPLVDSVAGAEYVFVGNDGSGSSGVYYFSRSSSSMPSPTESTMGSATSTGIYAGAFDELYWTAPGSAGSRGDLYVCAGNTPTLYRIPISTSVPGTAVDITSVTSAGATCSPVTEIPDTIATTFLTSAMGATSLASAMGTTDTAAYVASTTGFTTGDYIQIDSEIMLVTGVDSIATTSLTADMGTTDTTAYVTSTTGFSTGDYIQIDSEIMLITGTDSTALTVTRAQSGTTAATHSSGSTVNELTLTVTRAESSTTAATHSSGTAVNDITGSVTSTSGFTSGDYILIDAEFMLITGTDSTTLTVTRAQAGTTAATHASGSQVDEIDDWIYLSVSANGSLTATGNTCTGACVYSWGTTSPLSALAPPANGLSAAGGSSGIIIDNTATTTGASQIYFSTLAKETCSDGTGGCAVQASQSALR